MVDWAKLTWNESWTRALAWVTGIPSAFLTFINSIQSVITDPTFKEYLSAIEIPSQVTVTLTVLSLLIWLAHGRKND